MAKKGFRLDPKYVIPWLFIALGVWVMATLPGAGVTGWTNIADNELEINTYPSDPAHDDYDIGFYHENATPTFVYQDLAASGTVQDAEAQFPSSESWDTGGSLTYVMIQTNNTVQHLLTDSVTRVVVTLSFTELGVANPNMSALWIGGGALSEPYNHEWLVQETFTNEVEFNSSGTYTITVDWTLATLNLYTTPGDFLGIILVFDSITAYPFANEIWSIDTEFQYSGVSTTTTWLYTILIGGGFVVGAMMLLPATGLVKTSSVRNFYRRGFYKRNFGMNRRTYYYTLAKRRFRRRRRFY